MRVTDSVKLEWGVGRRGRKTQPAHRRGIILQRLRGRRFRFLTNTGYSRRSVQVGPAVDRFVTEVLRLLAVKQGRKPEAVSEASEA